jgi:hypothetical protein
MTNEARSAGMTKRARRMTAAQAACGCAQIVQAICGTPYLQVAEKAFWNPFRPKQSRALMD